MVNSLRRGDFYCPAALGAAIKEEERRVGDAFKGQPIRGEYLLERASEAISR